MRLLLYSPLLFPLAHVHAKSFPNYNREIKATDDNYRPQGNLTSPEIEALPSYDTVNVATIHFEYDGHSRDVPEVKAELSAMQFIFQQYGFSVRDITIPKSPAAQSFLEDQIKALYKGLSGPGSLAIIIYGGHGLRNGVWAAKSDFDDISVDWKSIDTNIIAPTGIDTFQLIDACHAASFLPQPEETIPDTYNGRGAFSVIAASSAESKAGTNYEAFTKAVIHTLAPNDNCSLPDSFTPTSLFRALPPANVGFAKLISDGGLRDAILNGQYKPEFYELGTTISKDSRKIGFLPQR